MPLTAKTKNGEIVYIPAFKKPEIEKRHPELFSPFPDCKDTKVSVVGRTGFVLFARHPPGARTEYESNPESPEHHAGKDYIRSLLLRDYGKEPLVEHPMVLPSGKKRIADVARQTVYGHLEIYEIQLSRISTEILEQRTRDYESLGHEVFWYFGKGANCQNLCDWARANTGGFGVLEFNESFVRS